MPPTLFSFKAFLSHRYKSSEVNLYFFDLFSKIAEVQFEIDKGTFSTNVTRLEKMVRNADAYVGIYPFVAPSEPIAIKEELQKQSKYFRLEMDLAIRSQKPGVVFYDKRYGDILKPPSHLLSCTFDANEVTGKGGFPQAHKHASIFKDFFKIVKAKKAYDDTLPGSEKNTVGLALSPEDYTDNEIQLIRDILGQYNCTDIRVIAWPPRLDKYNLSLIEKLDFAVTDVGNSGMDSGLPAYLHGRFIPSIRLRKEIPGRPVASAEPFLYTGVEVGYEKDIAEWQDTASLTEILKQKLEIINYDVTRINNKAEAEKYFQSAALRKEAVFLSYSRYDLEKASMLSGILKKYFQSVFNYRDGESIEPGQPWMEEIFNKLAASAIGIQVLSQPYFESGNCRHEAVQMVTAADEGKMKLIPVKLDDAAIVLPSFMGSRQYMRLSEYADMEEMVQRIVSIISGK